MELAIPLVALGGLYIISKQSKNETFKSLPNTDIPDINYPRPSVLPETALTSKLSTVNTYEGGSYTDKFFNPDAPNSMVANQMPSSSAEYYSLTGNKVDSTYFQHNNMQPYFGGSIRSRQFDAKQSESIMDNYTGSGSQTITKKEQAPLFAPGEHYQWANGAPNMTDFYQSRVNVGMKMSNVKPFAEESVAPGLGLGYTTEGMGGFNSGMAMRETWMPRNVDELRIDNNPKSSGNSLFGFEGPAMSRVSTLGAIGRMEKNRPDTAVEMGSDRLFTTTGLEKGQTMRALPIDRYVSRPETTTDYIGTAGLSNSTYTEGEFMPSTHIDLGAVPISTPYAGGKHFAAESDYGIKTNFVYPNNRSSNTQSQYFGGASHTLSSIIAPVLDLLRPSRRENTIGNLRPYQNAKPAVASSYVYNPNDRPAPTIRETTETGKSYSNINTNQRGGAYEITQQQPMVNARSTTTDYLYVGNASAGERSREQRSYEAEYNQRNNDVKSSTIQGYMTKGNMSLHNSNINMTGKAKDFQNTRTLKPNMPYASPSLSGMGRLQGKDGLHQTINMDRNTPDILDAFRQNPYTHSLTNTA